MKIYREQPLGLVRSIIRANGVDEAVRIADDTDHGSAAAVFGREITSARAVARRSQRGICHINDATVADDAQVPLGGMKAGGYGRFGGKAVINEFTDFRWIAIEGPQHYPFRRRIGFPASAASPPPLNGQRLKSGSRSRFLALCLSASLPIDRRPRALVQQGNRLVRERNIAVGSGPQASQARCSATCAIWGVVIGSIPARRSRQNSLEDAMTWKTPKIVEVPVGMEINMYACAARK